MSFGSRFNNRRIGNVLIRRPSSPPAPPAGAVITTLGNQADMLFFAQYAAAYPGVAAVGDQMDTATQGANVANVINAPGNSTTTFTGIGSILGTHVTGGFDPDNVTEILIVSGGFTCWACEFDNFQPPYNANAAFGGSNQLAMPSMDISALVAGDRVGIINLPASGLTVFFLNGVFNGQAGQFGAGVSAQILLTRTV